MASPFRQLAKRRGATLRCYSLPCRAPHGGYDCAALAAEVPPPVVSGADAGRRSDYWRPRADQLDGFSGEMLPLPARDTDAITNFAIVERSPPSARWQAMAAEATFHIPYRLTNFGRYRYRVCISDYFDDDEKLVEDTDHHQCQAKLDFIASHEMISRDDGAEPLMALILKIPRRAS